MFGWYMHDGVSQQDSNKNRKEQLVCSKIKSRLLFGTDGQTNSLTTDDNSFLHFDIIVDLWYKRGRDETCQ